AHVPVKECRSVDCRQNCGTVLTGLGRQGKAIRVDELVRPETGSRIARQEWTESNVRSPEDRDAANLDAVWSPVNREPVRIQRKSVVVVRLLNAGEVRAALRLDDTRQLPPVQEPTCQLFVDRIPQLYGVRDVKNMRAVRGLYTIVVVDAELV